MDLFSKVLDKIEDGMSITFTVDNVHPCDHFLILYPDRPCTVTFHTSSVPYWVEFDGDEPMLLENCPDTFFLSILKNIK